ncbi:MAG: LPS export ABC transporter ATP-binding protein [Thermoguttaceae bacterium]
MFLDKNTTRPLILKVEGLVKIYGKRRVVDGVSFDVRRGEIVGLLGPNGAGKTTSFRMACGLISTNGGTVYLGAHDVTNWPMYRRSREGGMGYLPQDKSVFQKLTVQNNLLSVMEMLGMKRAERKKRCNELLEKLQLTKLRKNYGGGLSGGERRRLEIARSLVSNPKIILLDEPFAAVDPITVAAVQDIIRQLASEGIAILITDHSVQDTLKITERSYVIQAGRVLCHGTPSEVLSNPEAQKVYFGKQEQIDFSQHSLNSAITRFSAAAESHRSDAFELQTKKASHSKRSTLEDRDVQKERVHHPHYPDSEEWEEAGSSPHAQLSHAQLSHAKQSESVLSDKNTSRRLELRRNDSAAAFQSDSEPDHPLQKEPHFGMTPTRESRQLGRRLVPARSSDESSANNSHTSESHFHNEKNKPDSSGQKMPSELSGVIRSLGAMIWKPNKKDTNIKS